MGKMKSSIYCYLIADILTEVLQKYFSFRSLQHVSFYSKHRSLIGRHGNRKVNFMGKNHLLRSYKGDKAET